MQLRSSTKNMKITVNIKSEEIYERTSMLIETRITKNLPCEEKLLYHVYPFCHCKFQEVKKTPE